jgi:transposase-like protein
MHRIVFAYLTLEQHFRAVISTPESYRPDRCPHCGNACLWGHGFYDRKADHSGRAELNPLTVPRFLCPACSRTCSRLPLCICPRRWYCWARQQLVLSLLLLGMSLRRTAAVSGLARHTVRRWWCWLQANSANFAFHLRSRFAELGRATDTASFWRACFTRMSLCCAMAWLDHDGHAVP